MNKLLMLSILILAFERGIKVKSGFLMNFSSFIIIISSLVIVIETVIELNGSIKREKVKLLFTTLELIVAACLLIYAVLSFMKITASMV
ncbi:MAG: hypothetical protein J1G30_04725 [Spirochaetales bacterium]|nr:hypothetical protein [Spirochaetales bacterium]